jgi:uncharacterized membrane protein
MDDIVSAPVIFAAVGLVFISLGIPLLRGRVPPNQWYGCRTDKTLSDDNIWYAVNRVTGRDLVFVGTVVMTSSLAALIFRNELNPLKVSLALLLLLIFSVVGMALHSFLASRRM